DVAHGVDRATGHAEADAEVADLQQGLHQSSPPAAGAGAAARPLAAVSALDGPANSLRGSKASRTASPTKTRRLSMMAREKKPVSPSHGACRLALPCASSSPSEAEPAGRPKPMKSSAVRVVMPPVRMKGRK